MTVKRITAANPNPTSGRSIAEAQHYWAETHGKLVANDPSLRRYHHYFSVPEAYESEPRATFIGASMFWRDDPFMMMQPEADGWFPVVADGKHLFDRSRRWPIDDQHADIVGEEHVLVDGPTTSSMVNAILMVCRLPGLDHRDFFEHWAEVHGLLAAKLPGLRRYIQCHALLEGFASGAQTHDGWSELWFDDFASFRAAVSSPEWAAMERDGRALFCEAKGVVVGREYVQKDESWRPRDYGVLSMTKEAIKDRLLADGYSAILEIDPEVAGKIKAAATNDRLAVWTPEHLVTLDASRIDVRPHSRAVT